jgi:hypothetical protein
MFGLISFIILRPWLFYFTGDKPQNVRSYQYNVTLPKTQHNRVSQPSKLNPIPGESIRFIYVQKRPEQL